MPHSLVCCSLVGKTLNSKDFQEAFVLHSRPYTDSRILVDWLSCADGLVSSVCRLATRKNQSAYQPFLKHSISLAGKGDLKTLLKSEPIVRSRYSLVGESLICGLYVNELLMRILAKNDPSDEMFYLYENAVQQLQVANGENRANQAALRCFELDALTILGYALDFGCEALNEKNIEPNGVYEFKAGLGFCLVETALVSSNAFKGDTLAKVQMRDFGTLEVLRAAKIICRSAFAPLLGGKPLKSRDLFK